MDADLAKCEASSLSEEAEAQRKIQLENVRKAWAELSEIKALVTEFKGETATGAPISFMSRTY